MSTVELRSAWDTLRNARRDAMPLPHQCDKRRRDHLALLLLACAVAWINHWTGLLTASDTDFWRGCMTALAVLSGFMIATMVFTGKLEAAKQLSYNQVQEVTRRLSGLLLFQFYTLGNHLLALACVAVLPMIAHRAPLLTDIATAFTITLATMSAMRSVLIPLQIMELHRFNHAAILAEKERDAQEAIRRL